MRFPEPKPQIKRTAGWLGDATSLFFVFICLLPTGLPNAAWRIEASWAQVLQTAFVERLQFGEQIVFTYGPWGFLYGGFQPETRLAGILAWAGLAAILWWALRCIATASFENNFARWLWIVLVASLTNQIESYTDVRLLCWPLSLLALHFFAEGRNVKIAKGLIIFSLGLIALIKFNLLIQSAIVILWVSADTVWRQRRFPWSLPLYIGSVLFFWLAAGQRLSLLGKFLRVSWEFASSYSEVMTLTGPNESRYIAWFALGALLLTMIFAVAVWQRLRIFFILPLAAFGLLIFTIFKYGFVRDDNAHQVDASVEMVLIALMCLAFLRP